MAECRPFITDDLLFPRRPQNRAALERIAYRIGGYPEFVELLMREINGAVELRAWTHRSPDDPGIALLESAAILGDILTFYQERYANEAFLRTATWRESIAALTRLLGYRLAPGVGGRASFAIEVKGSAPVEVPVCFPIKAELAQVEEPAEFQTTEALQAHASLSRFHLYRQRYYGTYLPTSVPQYEIASVGGASTLAGIDRLGLKAGDRLMLVSSAPSWLSSGTSMSAVQKTPQVVKVKSVKRHLGRTIFELEAPLRETWTLPVTAYRIGRSFRHFGHNAPPKYTLNTKNASNKIDGATEHTTLYERHPYHECAMTSSSVYLPAKSIPLDQEVNDLLVGGQMIVQATVRQDGGSTYRRVTVVRTIAGTESRTLGFGSLNGATTVIELDTPLTQSAVLSLFADIRSYQLHEVTGPPIQLQMLPYFLGGGFSTGTDALCFYGTQAEAKRLPGRRLLLTKEGETIELRVTSQPADFALPSGAAADEPRMWPVSFDRPPKPFQRVDFDELEPKVTVFGNVVEADQGKAEADVALGNGDGRARFQTFRVPKTPLTYHISAGATPPQVPELEIFVNGRMWTRVSSLFGQAADAEIYIVREDAEGNSYVQFGDGETGARLPSGIRNVVARYRSGNGAHGPVKAGTTPSAGRRIEHLDKVQLPGIVAGGAEAESGENARATAPGRIQSLGRMVSVRDYETELLTIPGITSATAAWTMVDHLPALVLRVLLDSGREAEFNAIRDTIQLYGRCRGPDRFPVLIEQAKLRYVFLDLLFAFDPRLRQEDVEARIRSALGLAGDGAAATRGVFGLRRRRLGEKEYARRIEGTVQNVPGVTWCRVAALGMFSALLLDPHAINLPASPRPLHAQLSPTPLQLLQLHERHLTLTSAPPPAAGECA